MTAQQCVICLEDLFDPPINEYLEANHPVALVCGHVFHLECIQRHHDNQRSHPGRPDEHFSLRTTCPSCRSTSLTQIRQTYSKDPLYVRLYFDGEAEDPPRRELKPAPDVARAMAICKRIRQIIGMLELADGSLARAVLHKDPAGLNEDGLKSYLKEGEAQLRALEELKMRRDVEANTAALTAALTRYASAIDLTAAANAAWAELVTQRNSYRRLFAEHERSELDWTRREREWTEGEAARIDAALGVARQEIESAVQERHEQELHELGRQKDETWSHELARLQTTLARTEFTLDKTLAEKDQLKRMMEQAEARAKKQAESDFARQLVQRQERWDAQAARAAEEQRVMAERLAKMEQELQLQRTLFGKTALKHQNELSEARKRARLQSARDREIIESKDAALQQLQQMLRQQKGTLPKIDSARNLLAPANREFQNPESSAAEDRSLEITLPGLDDPLSQAQRPRADAHPTRRTFEFTSARSDSALHERPRPIGDQTDEVPSAAATQPLVFSIGAKNPLAKLNAAPSFFARTGPRHAQPPPAGERRTGLKPANSHVDAFGRPVPHLASGPKRLIKP